MTVHANNTTVLYDDKALQAYLKTAAPNSSVAMYDATTLADSSVVFQPGLRNTQFVLSGLFDEQTGAGTLLEDITSRLGSSTATATTISPAGFGIGNAAWLLPALTVDYQLSSTVSDLVPFTLTLGAGAGAGLGSCLTDLAALTATGNAASQDNGAGTSNGAVANLHVTDVSGSTPSMTMIIQHSTNNSTWTTLGSFSVASTAGSQTLQISGTVNRYVRASYTISGSTPSFTTLVALSRF